MLARGDHHRLTGRVLKRSRKFERSALCSSERRTANAIASPIAAAGTAACTPARASAVTAAGAATCTTTRTSADPHQFGIGRLLAGTRR